ncbi:F-box protein At3g07870-like [Papaver somniferum]|uniref:F-box protein At3g07870-like n=1 Tax=Papaver somniferum TaxID=3469 RepID=UPI000E6F8753|nr:F-box protein At3g07870-like [Papaver somniferum]
MKGLNSLPEGIILDILTRVPTESVLDCKLVYKPWRDLIGDPSFSQLHFNLLDSADDSGKLSFIILSCENMDTFDPGMEDLYYTEYDENCHETPFSRKMRMHLNPEFKKYSFVGSCNGLICFGPWFDCLTSYNVSKFHYGPVYICNPVSKEHIILPNFEGVYKWSGFGYSHSTNEYKVVRICLDSDEPNFGIPQVYTVGSGNGWRNLREMDMELKNIQIVIFCAGMFANEALHWVNKDKKRFLAFHLADEKFSELPLPPCGVQNLCPTLGVLGDFLSAYKFNDTYGGVGDCEIWLLKKNKDNNYNDLSWSKEFRFDSFDSYISPPFGYTRSGNLLFYGDSKFYIYDSEASSTDVNFGKDRIVISKNERDKESTHAAPVIEPGLTMDLVTVIQPMSTRLLESVLTLTNRILEFLKCTLLSAAMDKGIWESWT